MDAQIIGALSIGAVAIYLAIRIFAGRRMSTTVIEKLQSGALVVDVRTAEEFEYGHYPNAKNIPLAEISNRMAEFGSDYTRPIIVYCASGSRSAKAEKILRAAGFSDVTNGGGLSDMPRLV